MEMRFNGQVITIIIIFILMSVLIGCKNSGETDFSESDTNLDYETAIFAGGCFWCTEADFEKVNGVVSVISGYTGGFVEQPVYEEVSAGKTGHVEAVKITFDQNTVTYGNLLEVYFTKGDPTDNGGQFVDRGLQYRPVIFYGNEGQKLLAEKAKIIYNNSGIFDEEVVVEILPSNTFYVAEEYHQDYYKKNPIRYKIYRGNSGRDQFLNKIWAGQKFELSEYLDDSKNGKSFVRLSQKELKAKLTDIQYKVTQEDATERPFDNEYWDNKEDGIYVDIVSGEPLFSSLDKYVSGTGWPSFTKPLEPDNVARNKDYKLILPRTELRSKNADSHLGHLFNDGPKDQGGLRYCINSAALRFIPKVNLEKEGYAEYGAIFK